MSSHFAGVLSNATSLAPSLLTAPQPLNAKTALARLSLRTPAPWVTGYLFFMTAASVVKS